MTTFHESQPQSRRAARQSERQEGPGQAEFTDEQPDGPQVYSVDGDSSQTDASTAAPVSAAPRGRRAAAPAGSPAAVTETVEIRLPQRIPVPSYDGPTFTNRAPRVAEKAETDPAAASEQSDDLPPTQAIQQVDRPAYRVRDFSPEGRRSAPQPGAQWMPQPAAQPAREGADAVDDAATVSSFRPPSMSDAPVVTSRPQFFVPESALQDTIVPSVSPASAMAFAAPDEPAPEATPEPEPVRDEAASEPGELPFPEHTMTRRELRALEAQRAAASQPAPQLPEFGPDGSLTGAAAAVFVETDFDDDNDKELAVDSEPAVVDSADADEPVAESTEAPPTLVEPTVAVGSSEEAAADDAAAVDEVAFAAPALSPFDALFQVPPALPQAAATNLLPPPYVPPADDDATAPADLVDPLAPAEAPAEASAAVTDASADFDSMTKESVDSLVSEVEPKPAASPASESSWTPPMGHWSAQGEVDEDAPSEGNISRTIGSGILTTNALVLPSVPDGADIRGPLTGTGEIMITGSIDLPRTLSSTGQSDRFDGDSMDALFDLGDAEIISTDSSPVRAIRAVSTHTSANGVTHTQKPKGTKALTGLLIAASSLAVVVAGLLVAAFAFNVF
ncbi:hypothetical protein QMG83_09635 [Salinibacterium sp. G-O1]|uniref:hypothetical protein n=1 Tax=Salinibacterium sp. G-O1 TaxID=3046208 RepID=UPI0024B94778|nr:hypothetical protein [Salinibacterium sp. G-O1]MDJ0335483.1 hypothetical protein [Salinibacterium sp. G-O1]